MNPDQIKMQNRDKQLDSLFAAYRSAVPDVDAGANFMPGLWQRIEARQKTGVMFRRLTGAFVAVAIAMTLLMGAVLIPRYQNEQVYTATYIDVLAAEHVESFDPAGADDAPGTAQR